MKKFLCITLMVLFGCIFSGCTFNGRHLTNVDNNLTERTRENNEAAYIASLEQKALLQHAKTLLNTAIITNSSAILVETNFNDINKTVDKTTNLNNIVSDFTKRNESILGTPVKEQQSVVDGLNSENNITKSKFESTQSSKEKEEEGLIAKRNKYEQNLQDYGQTYESQRNAKILFWFKWGGLATLLIGGIISLFIFFPPAAGLLVGVFPKLASIFGVVSHSAFSSVIKGIGNARSTLQIQIDTAKTKSTPEPTYTATEVLTMLDNHLSESTPDKIQKLVDATRDKVNV